MKTNNQSLQENPEKLQNSKTTLKNSVVQEKPEKLQKLENSNFIKTGIVAINKPSGWTSFDVVNKIKHLLHAKTGHLGTLDPMATGVLLVTIGKATKLFDIMQEKQKTYLAKFEFGYITDTLDATGKVESTTNNLPTRAQIEAVLVSFLGEIDQLPPKYSAKSVGGKRAYDLARQNIDFELQPKKVKIYSLKIVDFQNNILTLEIVCGSGTYIRALGRDIAKKVNSLATMTELIRTQIGSFGLKDCQEISNLSAENINILSIDKVLNYKTLNLPEQEKTKLLHGQTIKLLQNNGNFFLKSENEIVAIVKVDNNLAKMSIFLG